MKKQANPGKVITELCFQFVVWTTGKVEKFPRAHKFTIGDRIHAQSINLMLYAVEATYSRERAAILRTFQIELEKSAWIMGLLLMVIGGWYINTVWDMSRELGQTAPPLLPVVAIATVMLIFGAAVGHIIIAVINPKEADDTEDERDKQVLRRSGNISGYVLGFGCFAGLWQYFVAPDGNLLFHIIVVSLYLSQIAEYALTIVFYRRDV